MQVGIQGQVQIGQGLRLDPLGRVDQQDRALAGRQRPGDLVGEVHVAGGVDEVQHVLVAIGPPPRQPDGLGFDGDAPFPLDIHAVQVLRAHLAGIDDPG